MLIKPPKSTDSDDSPVAPVTAKELIAAMQRGLSHEHFQQQGGKLEAYAPWKLIAYSDVGKLSQWYEEAKPNADLIALSETDAATYSEIVDGRAAREAIRKFLGTLFSDRRLTFDQRQTKADLHKTENAEQYRLAAKYTGFIDTSLSSFRPREYPHVDFFILAKNFYGMYYGLYQNEHSGEYLLTFTDRRNPDGPLASDQKPLCLIEYATFHAPDINEEQALETARWRWSEHMTILMRFYPTTDRNKVAALFEADRIRKHHDNLNPGSATPHPGLFEYYPAFMRAYLDREGMLRAFHDVFGPRGTSVDLSASNHGDPNRRVVVTARHFIEMYEQMGLGERVDFIRAFLAFSRREFPAMHIALEAEDKANTIRDDLASIGFAIKSGTGAWRAVNTELALRNERINHFQVSPLEDALEEADRIRNHHLAALSDVTINPSALPKRRVFQHPEAFVQAYPGQDNVIRMMYDLYGPSGNYVYCLVNESRPNSWGHIRNKPEIYLDYGINSNDLQPLYARLGPGARTAFRKGIEAFIASELPLLALKDDPHDRGSEIAGTLACVEQTIRLGLGSFDAVNSADILLPRSEELEGIATNDPFHLRIAQRMREKRASFAPIY